MLHLIKINDKLCLKELVSLNDLRCILKDLVVESPDVHVVIELCM